MARAVCPFGVCVHTDSLLLFPADSMSTSVDLSKATGLVELTLVVRSSRARWVTSALQTITAKHRDLRRVSISLDYYGTIITCGTDFGQFIGEPTLGEWLELDRLLSQLWESYSIPPKIICFALIHKDEIVRSLVGRLLPETTVGGITNLVGWQ